MNPIILASQSPRRKQLLEWAEIPFEIIIRETAETFPASMAVEDVPVHIARNKALAVQAEVPAGKIILAADTVVVLGERIIGKPQSREDAIQILTDLSGNKHRVITGVVMRQGENETAFADITEVYF
ncbi:MAG: Maf family protein, partial [Chitinophagaceae bacterium]|nr:Maf family protein [Chitinophagaceae bacterium]